MPGVNPVQRSPGTLQQAVGIFDAAKTAIGLGKDVSGALSSSDSSNGSSGSSGSSSSGGGTTSTSAPEASSTSDPLSNQGRSQAIGRRVTYLQGSGGKY